MSNNGLLEKGEEKMGNSTAKNTSQEGEIKLNTVQAGSIAEMLHIKSMEAKKNFGKNNKRPKKKQEEEKSI